VRRPQISHSDVWLSYGEKAIDGDPEALGQLLETYRPILSSLANRSIPESLKPKIGTSDIVQQTCEDAVAGLPDLRARNGRSFWKWLTSLLSKNVADVHRRFVASEKRSVDRELDMNVQELPKTSGSSLVQRVSQKELAEHLSAALQRIPPAHRQMLQWRFLEERSCEEIGQMVSRTPDAVRMMVGRSLKRLQQEMPGGWSIQ